MKNIVTMVVSMLLGAVTLLIVMVVNGRMNRSMELKSNLPSAVEETVEILADQKYSIGNANEYLADFVENLARILDSDCDLKVEIISKDTEKGLLSVRVTEEFLHPNGKNGTVECERTVILNKLYEPEPEIYTVRFFVNKSDIGVVECYKSIQVLEGDMITAPAAPQVEGKTFAGWKDSNDYIVNFSAPVTQDLVYYAAWN